VRGGCVFCRLDPERILLESTHGVVLRDAFPVNPGHLLVVPRVHVASLFQLPTEVQGELWDLVRQARALLAEDLRPDGFTVGLNDGEAAGQTVSHAHIHVIPRYAGDVPDPRGGIRWVIPGTADYWTGRVEG
jgi:diadenosine tetraphosphate (Ap4A) HIT family hydrolase